MRFTSGIGTRLLLITAGVIILLVGSFCFVTGQEIGDEAIENLVNESRAISTEAEAARQYIARLRAQHNAFDDKRLLEEAQKAIAGARTPAEIIERARPTAFYASIPIVASWTVAQTNSEKSGYKFKVPKVQPRNPANEPDAIEREMLEKLTRTNAQETWRIDEATNSLRFMKPIVLGADCLICHGTPDHYPAGNGKDPLGLPMEGWKEGEVHGGFEVIADLGPVKLHTRDAILELVSIATLFLSLALALLYFVIRKLVTTPLARAVSVLERVGQGDLTPRLTVDGDDEVSRMGRSLNAALNGVEDTLVGVQATANEMSIASRELSSAATHLSDTAQQQAANMEQTNASLAGITSVTKQSADSAKHTSDLTVAAHDRATEGGQIVGSAVDSINDARDASKQIVEIIQTIDDIAAQTNLLALNATVEAARAGEHGRGFAVVAGEVRELSLQTAQAARRIQKLIENTVGKVEVGARFAEKSRESLADIVSRVKQVTDTVQEIASATAEQSSGISQVHDAMGRLDLLVQGTASQTEELAATAEALNANAARLNELVAKFQLSGSAAPAQGAGYQAPLAPKTGRPFSARSSLPHGAPAPRTSAPRTRP
jgi:methyl-accepting chemotaxis protein